MRKPTIQIIAKNSFHGYRDDDFYIACESIEILNKVTRVLEDAIEEFDDTEYDDKMDYVEEVLKEFFDKGEIEWTRAYESSISF